MNALELALVDLAKKEGVSESTKLFAARALLQERRDRLIERRMTRLYWLLGVVAIANLINAALQVARLTGCQ